jgi:hypothetical protein
MTTEVQAQTGQRPTHRTADATRDIPHTAFPRAACTIWPAATQHRPLCRPEYGAAVQ